MATIQRPNKAPAPEPQGIPEADNPLNPRGVPSSDTSGTPDAQATDAQKAQNPEPKRVPIPATMYPDPNLERVSAGQNRRPVEEIIP